jgi:RNA polymerase sporulation-specific sigma factor
LCHYNDEELLYLSRQGCAIAYRVLIEEYYRLIHMIYRRMKLQQTKSVDENEVVQITMITCIKSFSSYREDRKTKLRTYMSHVIKHSIFSAVKKGNRDYVRYYTFSLDGTLLEPGVSSYEEMVADKRSDYQPGKALYIKEAQSLYYGYAQEHCSYLEKEVMVYRMQGYSNRDAARALGVDIKTIYNAVYRLQKKLQGVK